MLAGMRPNTEAIWAERIEEWVQSGQSATEFAEGKPYTSGTLTWAASQLRKGGRGNRKRREGGARSARKPKIRMAEVVQRSSSTSVAERVVLEVGGAVISVRRGFDRTLLQDVVLALRGAR
jgi:hypothetical protein